MAGRTWLVELPDGAIAQFRGSRYPPDRAPPTCDYCGEKPAEGYVSAYDTHVCQECYEDHHGDI